MNLIDFLSNFKTFKQHVEEDPNALPAKIAQGLWVRNEDQCRLELLYVAPRVRAIGDLPPVCAWINYCALVDNPAESFKQFILHRLYKYG